MKIVGTKEAGVFLGWDTRKVSTYNSRKKFPKPILTLASGPIWFKEQIVLFYQHVVEKKKVYYIKEGALYLCKYGLIPDLTSIKLTETNGEKNYILFDSNKIDSILNILENNSTSGKEWFQLIIELYILRDFNIISEEVIHSFTEGIHSFEHLPVNSKE